MNIIEQNGNKYKLGLFGTKIISVAKVHTITFNNEGKINRFGSIILKAKENIYRVIFNIDKGRIRFVKIIKLGSLLIDSLLGFLILTFITLIFFLYYNN